MPLHDQVASVMSLARVIRAGIDDTKTHTPVQNASLKLLIDTFLEVATPPHHHKHAAEAAKSVAEMIAPAVVDTREGNRRGWI